MGLELLRVLDAHQNVDCLAFSPDGATIATGGGSVVQFWDTRTWKVRDKLKGLTGHRVSRLVFAADSKRLASVEYNGTLRLWNVQNGELLLTTRLHRGVVFSVSFSPDGRIVATGGRDGLLLIWDSHTGEVLRRFDDDGSVLSVGFSSEGQTLVAGCGQERRTSSVKFWNVPKGELMQVWTGHADWPLWAAFSPDGVSVGSGSYGECLIRAAKTGALKRALKPQGWSMVAFDFSPDGKTIATGGWDHSTEMKEVPGGWNQVNAGRLQLWNVLTGDVLENVVAHDQPITDLAFSPAAGLLATAGRDKTLKLWDIWKH